MNKSVFMALYFSSPSMRVILYATVYSVAENWNYPVPVGLAALHASRGKRRNARSNRGCLLSVSGASWPGLALRRSDACVLSSSFLVFVSPNNTVCVCVCVRLLSMCVVLLMFCLWRFVMFETLGWFPGEGDRRGWQARGLDVFVRGVISISLTGPGGWGGVRVQ